MATRLLGGVRSGNKLILFRRDLKTLALDELPPTGQWQPSARDRPGTADDTVVRREAGLASDEPPCCPFQPCR
ncbi:hypothetical protein [Saccharopolyspora sp. 5N708]|uniref:hypothetical protein n=1 Tax=Saccharopolyspora sp. 5N708 TaxID=3457424 RepID=UPI003FD58D4C